MKKIALVLAALAALSMTGCSSDTSTDSGASTSTDLDFDAESSDEGRKAMGRDLLREQHPEEFGHFTDDLIDQLAEATCEGMDNGLTPDDVFYAGVETYGPAIGGVMALSALAYCPQHNAAMEAWMN